MKCDILTGLHEQRQAAGRRPCVRYARRTVTHSPSGVERVETRTMMNGMDAHPK